METIKSYGFGALVLAGWMAVAAYTVTQLGSMPTMPTMRAPEMTIDVGTRLAQGERPHQARHR